MEDDQDQRPESLLPYDEWTQQALRHVAERALLHLATEGLPGEHHFYLTFRTDHPSTVVPARLKAQYPQEMTIVLQHQFRDAQMADGLFSVVLSFGGVPSTLVVPLAAITGFADPAVQFVLRFQSPLEVANVEVGDGEKPADPKAADTDTDIQGDSEPRETPQVVSLDAFRRRTPPKT